MASKKRQLNKEEKKKVIEQQKNADGILRCYISGRIIDLEEDKIEFDHLKAFSQGGPTVISNVRVFLKEYNREKGKMCLAEYKEYFEMKRLYDLRHGKLKLQDVYEHQGVKPENTAGVITNDKIVIEGGNLKKEFDLIYDPIVKTHYCYARVPVNWMRNDEDEGLQPRNISNFKRLWGLKQHLSVNTQLAPSISRFKDNEILVFDGQHKLAAQLLNGATEADVKIYISPEDEDEAQILYEKLLKTNLDAHHKHKQVPFHTNTLLQKWNEMHQLKWDDYLDQNPNETHSENSFFEHLVSQEGKPEATKMFSATILKNAHDNSSFKHYTSEANKDSKFPLSQDLLKKTILKSSLFVKPSKATVESANDYRESEIINYGIISEIITEKGHLKDWTPSKTNLTPHQKKVRRIWTKGSVMTWSSYIHSMINATFQLFDADTQEKKLYQAEMSDQQKEAFHKFFERLFNHPFWDQNDHTIDKALTASTSVKEIFDSAGLNWSYILNGD